MHLIQETEKHILVQATTARCDSKERMADEWRKLGGVSYDLSNAISFCVFPFLFNNT